MDFIDLTGNEQRARPVRVHTFDHRPAHGLRWCAVIESAVERDRCAQDYALLSPLTLFKHRSRDASG